jgi:DNA-binding protein HU-beta
MSRDAAQLRRKLAFQANRRPTRALILGLVAAETPLSLRARIISLTAAHFRASEEGNPSWRFRAQAKRKHQRLLPKASPVTLKHLAARLAKDHQLTKRAGEAILGDLVSLITKHLKKGERVRISGFGILQVRSRAARMGRNPATGEAIKIKASKKVAFRPAKDLKLAI